MSLFTIKLQKRARSFEIQQLSRNAVMFNAYLVMFARPPNLQRTLERPATIWVRMPQVVANQVAESAAVQRYLPN